MCQSRVEAPLLVDEAILVDEVTLFFGPSGAAVEADRPLVAERVAIGLFLGVRPDIQLGLSSSITIPHTTAAIAPRPSSTKAELEDFLCALGRRRGGALLRVAVKQASSARRSAEAGGPPEIFAPESATLRLVAELVGFLFSCVTCCSRMINPQHFRQPAFQAKHP